MEGYMRKNSAAKGKANSRSYGRTYHNFKAKAEPKLLNRIDKIPIVNVINDFRIEPDGGKIWSF